LLVWLLADPSRASIPYVWLDATFHKVREGGGSITGAAAGSLAAAVLWAVIGVALGTIVRHRVPVLVGTWYGWPSSKRDYTERCTQTRSSCRAPA